MSQKQRIQPEQVLEQLRANNNQLKLAKIAKNLKCSQPTVSLKVRKLRMQGHSILPTNKGLLLVDIVNEGNADKIHKTGNWLIGEMVRMSLIGKVTKTPLIQVRKVLELTKAEREQLKLTLVQLTNLITTVNVEEDLK